MEYVVYDKFKAKCVPEFVLFEKWELEERKLKKRQWFCEKTETKRCIKKKES